MNEFVSGQSISQSVPRNEKIHLLIIILLATLFRKCVLKLTQVLILSSVTTFQLFCFHPCPKP